MPTPPIPGQPHPDVAIVKAVLKEIAPGGVLPYADASKSIGLQPDDPVFRRRADAARKQLVRPEEGGIVITIVPGTGFLRELPGQTTARIAGREMRSIARKSRRNGNQLATIDIAEIPEGERPEVYALRVINKAVQTVASKPARLKLTAAATAVSAEITVTKALEVLQDREKET